MNKQNRQRYAAIALTIVLVFLVFIWFYIKPSLGINLLLGFLFGIIMSRTKFSFAGNLRSPVMNNDFHYSRLIFMMTVITFIGMLIVMAVETYFGIFNYEKYVSTVTAVSPYFCFAAVIFGIGSAVLGCAGSGLIRRAANLQLPFIIATVFYFIGSLSGVLCRDRVINLTGEKILYLPEMFDWPTAILIQIALLGVYYYIAFIWRGGKDKHENKIPNNI